MNRAPLTPAEQEELRQYKADKQRQQEAEWAEEDRLEAKAAKEPMRAGRFTVSHPARSEQVPARAERDRQKDEQDEAQEREQASREANKKDPSKPVYRAPAQASVDMPTREGRTDYLAIAPSPEQFNVTMGELGAYLRGQDEAKVRQLSDWNEGAVWNLLHEPDYESHWDDDPIEASKDRDEYTLEVLAAMKACKVERPLKFRAFFLGADQRAEYERVREVEEGGSGTARRRKKGKAMVAPHLGETDGYCKVSRRIVEEFLRFLPATAQGALLYCYYCLSCAPKVMQTEGRFLVTHDQVARALGFSSRKVGKRALACLCRAGIIRLLRLGRPGVASEYLFLEPDGLDPAEAEEKVTAWRARPGNGGQRPGAGRPRGSEKG